MPRIKYNAPPGYTGPLTKTPTMFPPGYTPAMQRLKWNPANSAGSGSPAGVVENPNIVFQQTGVQPAAAQPAAASVVPAGYSPGPGAARGLQGPGAAPAAAAAPAAGGAFVGADGYRYYKVGSYSIREDKMPYWFGAGEAQRMATIERYNQYVASVGPNSTALDPYSWSRAVASPDSYANLMRVQKEGTYNSTIGNPNWSGGGGKTSFVSTGPGVPAGMAQSFKVDYAMMAHMQNMLDQVNAGTMSIDQVKAKGQQLIDNWIAGMTPNPPAEGGGENTTPGGGGGNANSTPRWLQQMATWRQ